jgi:hypothetical protein
MPLQDHHLADVVQQAAQERGLRVGVDVFGDQPGEIGGADPVIDQPLPVCPIDVPVLHARADAERDRQIPDRDRADAHDRFRDRADVNRGAVVRGVGKAEQPGGEDLILRDDLREPRNGDVRAAGEGDNAGRDLREHRDVGAVGTHPVRERTGGWRLGTDVSWVHARVLK